MDDLEKINSLTRHTYNVIAGKYHELFHDEMYKKAYDRELLNNFSRLFEGDVKILDAGCGPSGHITRFIADIGLNVTGVDISDSCVENASKVNPDLKFQRMDISHMEFEDASFDGIVSFYSIINTPCKYLPVIFNEFYRVLKPNGYLLVVVKEGTGEGYIDEILGFNERIYNTSFTEESVKNFFETAGFNIKYIQARDPYNKELQSRRIYCMGKKGKSTGQFKY